MGKQEGAWEHPGDRDDLLLCVVTFQIKPREV